MVFRFRLGWVEASVSLLMVFFLYFLWHSFAVLSYPLWLDESEGFSLDSTVEFLRSGVLYPDLDSFGAYPRPYPPVWYVLSSFFMFFFGRVILAGRLLSFFASFLCGLVLYRICRYLTGDYAVALGFSLLFFASRFVFLWSPLFRVDFLGLLFSLCGIYFALKHPMRVLPQVLFFVLAFFTKQSFIAAPLAVFFFTLCCGEKSLGLVFFF